MPTTNKAWLGTPSNDKISKFFRVTWVFFSLERELLNLQCDLTHRVRGAKLNAIDGGGRQRNYMNGRCQIFVKYLRGPTPIKGRIGI